MDLVWIYEVHSNASQETVDVDIQNNRKNKIEQPHEIESFEYEWSGPVGNI